MRRFFCDFEALNRFTLNLDYHSEPLECPHCLKCEQFISHGVVYKRRSIEVLEAVGKRLFCSNRYGRSGCGRTVQLYVATQLPYLRYQAAHLFVFFTSLLLSMSVRQAYQKATGQTCSRHAWRWLKRLERKFIEYRGSLKRRIDTFNETFQTRVRRLQVLLPTLNQLCIHFNPNPCVHYQIKRQTPFF